MVAADNSSEGFFYGHVVLGRGSTNQGDFTPLGCAFLQAAPPLLNCMLVSSKGVLCGVGVISNAGKREEGAVRAAAAVVVAATVLPLK